MPRHTAIRAGNLGLPRRPSAPPGCAARRSAWSAAAGSARRRPLRAKALGLDVVFYDPYLRQGMDKAWASAGSIELDELLEQSHFVSLHCYLDEATHHLINARTIARMRPGPILINTARGPVVDETALLDALDSGHLAGAGLDVVEREPLDDERLRKHPERAPHAAHGLLQRRRATSSCGPRPPRKSGASCSANRRANPVNLPVSADMLTASADREERAEEVERSMTGISRGFDAVVVYTRSLDCWLVAGRGDPDGRA